MTFDPQIAAIRLGYGLSPLTAPPATAGDLLDSVRLAGMDQDPMRMRRVRRVQDRLVKLNARMKNAQGAEKADTRDRKRAYQRKIRDLERQLVQRRIARAVGDPAGFGERLVQFWSDHFTVSGGGLQQMLMAASLVDEAIRPHLSGRFADMMFAAETHPRMLTYLDQARSFGPNSTIARRQQNRELGLNENLAREMIELHSLGVAGDYTQTDVRQLAKLLTGLTYNARKDQSFRPGMAEPGAETVLGRSYGGDGPARLADIRAVIDDLAGHEDTASHLARKLAVHFVSDDPPAGLIGRLAAVYRETDGDLGMLSAALAEAPEVAAHFRAKMRQPFDFLVAALRGLGFDRDAVMALPLREAHARLINPLKGMGQDWGRPRGPDGWPEAAESWVTPQGLATRIDWAMRHPAKLVATLPDPRSFLISTLGDTASDALRWAVPKAESAREGLAIILASSDFNRR
ncbi:DUF1800 domain-containing protein [Paracoccus salsus]|uniref:DUF1800 domain-containing protein n=1 Tax=Paracoccus salsus TaxID=2911061 RepID=UPI001F31F3E6|nr:DUF1800 domain-containing protein [Paracoccus salsus]MCF3972798.1 DUF1800 domain-containing protein [Paracoccus salsus]